MYPEQYYDKFIAEGARPDGRPLGRARPVSLARGVVTTAQGSALAKVGRTTAIAAVKLEFVAPALDAPDLGVLEVTVELPPDVFRVHPTGTTVRGGGARHPSHRRRPRGRAGRGPHQAVHQGGPLGVEGFLDVYCLDNDGGVIDVGLLAAIAAPETASPFASVDDRGKVHGRRETKTSQPRRTGRTLTKTKSAR